MMKRWLGALLCAALLLVPLGGAATTGVLPSGLAEADLAAAVDAYVEANLDTTAAVSVGVTRGGQTLLSRAYGYADIASGLAADAETVYEWGSVSKLLVWVSAMQLVEQGKLDLTADIRTYLPDGFLTKLSYDTPITMMNLMHHNAGWEEVLLGVFAPPTTTIGSLTQTLRASEPSQIYEPGAVCAYSNWGVALAGLIVERVSGEPFHEYVQRHIFAPLDMVHTALSPTLEDNAWVRAHRPMTQGYMGVQPTPHLFSIPLYPAGMATGTLNDFLRFAQALLPEDGAASPLFAQPDTLNTLLTPSLFYGDGSARNSHGFWTIDFGVPTLGHGGNTAAFSSHLLIDPVSNVGFVVMTNQGQETVYNTGLPKLVFGEFAPQKAAGEMPDARALQGLYRSGRIPMNGCAKLYGVVNMMPLFGGDENSLEASMMGQSMLLNQVQPDLFVLDERSTIRPVERLRAERTPDGGALLSAPYFDFVRIPASEGVWTLAVLLLLVLAMGYCGVALIGGGSRRLGLRLRRRRGETSSMRKYHLLMCAFGLAEVVNIALLAVGLMTYQPALVIGLFIGFTWLYAAAALLYWVLLVSRMRKLDCGRKEKALYAWTGVCVLTLLLNIVVWQLYRF